MRNIDPQRVGAGRRALIIVMSALGCLLLAAYLGVLREGEGGVGRGELAPVAGADSRALRNTSSQGQLADPLLVSSGQAARDSATSGVRLAGNGKLTGVVLERQSGVGVADARVELLPLPPVGSAFIGRLLRLTRMGEGFTRRARPAASTYADSLGLFEFEGVREGRYYIDITSDYFLMEAPQRVSVLASGDGGPVDVWVREGGRVLGQVLDSEDRAVAGATVLLTAGPNLFLESAREGSLRVLETRANEEGRFGFGGVAEGQGYDLTATAPRIAISHLSEVNVARGEDTEVILRARVGGTVLGRVFSARVDDDGDERGRVPLVGAHVGAIPRGMRDLRFVEEVLRQTHCVADEDGAYRMTRVPPGDVDIVVFAPKHVLGAGTLVIVREGEVSSAAPISLETGEQLLGRVVDSQGQPVAGVHVTWPTFDVRAMRRRGMDLSFAPFLMQAVEGFAFPYTDEEGRFAAGPFPGAPPYRLRFYKAGFRETELEYTPSDDLLEVVLQRGGAVEGVVMDLEAAEPLTSFTIQTIDRIETTDDAPGRFNSFSGGQVFEGPSGRFALDSMRPGEVEFTVSAEGYMPRRVEGVEVVEGETKRGVIISMVRGGTVRGVVVDSEGDPIPGANVMAFDSSVKRGREFRRRDPTKLPTRMPRFSEGLPPALLGYAAGLGLLADDVVRTATDGSYELTGVPAGRMAVVALHPAYASGSSDEFVLPEGESVDEVHVELSSGAAVFGTVKDRNGVAVGATMVVALSPARFAGQSHKSAGGGLYQTQTDLEGAYELEHMSGGSYFIVSTRGDAALNPLSFFSTLDFDLVTVPADERVRFDIVDESLGGTRVFGRVLEAGAPVSRGNINAISWEGENALGVDWKVARIDAEGGYEFEGLAPGEYQFQIDGLAQRVKLAIDIPDTSEHHLDLELPRGVIAGRVLDEVSGEPVVRARVYLRPKDVIEADSVIASLMRQGGELYRERTNGAGEFTFASLGEGEYELQVDPAGAQGERSLAPSEAMSIELGREELRDDLEIRLLAAAELEGFVRDEFGAAVEGARVACRRTDGAEVKDKSSETDAEGKFRVSGLSAGEHSVIVTARGYANAREDQLVVDDGSALPLEVVLERGVQVTLILTGSDGKPVSGAGARIVRSDAPGAESADGNSLVKALFSGKATTDSRGELDLGRFVGGTYELSVSRGLARKKVAGIELDAGDDSVRLRVTLD